MVNEMLNKEVLAENSIARKMQRVLPDPNPELPLQPMTGVGSHH